MHKKCVFLMVLLGLLLSPASYAANIIWVAQAYDTDGDGTQDDQAAEDFVRSLGCLLYTSPSPRDRTRSRMPSSA